MINSLENAIQTILSYTKSRSSKEIKGIEDIAGYILAQDVYTIIDIPPFDRSPLDGYALISSDTSGATKETPIQLDVIGTVFAGDNTGEIVKNGQAFRIMTGAPIPKNCDCVIRQENTDYGETKVSIYEQLSHNENYCFAGEDVKRDTLLIEKGTKLDYRHIGALATQGIPDVKVFQKPRIMFITTGNELLPIKSNLQAGKIYNSNLYLLKNRMLNLGVDVESFSVGDDVEKTCDIIKQNYTRFDAIITTGGVSVGTKDIIHSVIDKLGANQIFWKVKIKPGTPVIFSVLDEIPILSLSGNPFASFATFELIARPMIAKISNDLSLLPKRAKGILQDEFLKESVSRRFVRANFEDGKVYFKSVNHSSGSISEIIKCNCLIDIEEGNTGLKVGDIVDIILF